MHQNRRGARKQVPYLGRVRPKDRVLRGLIPSRHGHQRAIRGGYGSGLILPYISQPPTTSRDALDPIASETAQYRAKADSFEDAFARVIGPLQKVYFLLILFFASIGIAIGSCSCRLS